MNDCNIQFNSLIAKGNDEVRIAFYANIGFYIEMAQMLEFNIRKLLCYKLSVEEIAKTDITKDSIVEIINHFDKYYQDTYQKRMTLGQLIKDTEKKNVFSDKIIESLKIVNDYRQKLVHKIFQNNVVSKDLENAGYVSNYTQNRLISMTNFTDNLNKEIIETILTYQEKLHDYKKRCGITI
ncbi:MAG: hypothetical protein ACLUSP_04445 [Christensenellales bacterium]